VNLKHFAKVTAEKAHGGHYFLLKDGKLIGGFNHTHILENLFDAEINDSRIARTYQTRFHAEACAIRVLRGKRATRNGISELRDESPGEIDFCLAAAGEQRTGGETRLEADRDAKSIAHAARPRKKPHR
jgi:hypothetical protein